VPGAGLDRIDRSALPSGAWLANVYGHEVGIAEYVLGLMLTLARGFPARGPRPRAGGRRQPHRRVNAGQALLPRERLGGRSRASRGRQLIWPEVDVEAVVGIEIVVEVEVFERIDPGPIGTGPARVRHQLTAAGSGCFVGASSPMARQSSIFSWRMRLLIQPEVPVRAGRGTSQRWLIRLKSYTTVLCATVCYMVYASGEVGVRELRQNLSIYLKRVKEGAIFEVKERGQRVAVLAPAGARSSALDRLIAAGRATPARGDLIDLGPPVGRPPTRRASRALSRLRDERR
jgi:antitoxin (DNA-binding transcriptional repressor) of toxin-antitoxin stability system